MVADVFMTEPLPASSPLWSHPKVTITPHVAAVTKPADVAACFGENLKRYAAGEPLKFVFDLERDLERAY